MSLSIVRVTRHRPVLGQPLVCRAATVVSLSRSTPVLPVPSRHHIHACMVVGLIRNRSLLRNTIITPLAAPRQPVFARRRQQIGGTCIRLHPVPGAMPNMMSREAAAPPSAAPPRSFFRSTFARCAGEEQEQQAADAADAFSIGPQPSSLHGTRRPLAAGQLGHLRNLLMHPARPPTPFRRPSHALSRTCRPLSFASRAPHALPSYLCT